MSRIRILASVAVAVLALSAVWSASSAASTPVLSVNGNLPVYLSGANLEEFESELYLRTNAHYYCDKGTVETLSVHLIEEEESTEFLLKPEFSDCVFWGGSYTATVENKDDCSFRFVLEGYNEEGDAEAAVQLDCGPEEEEPEGIHVFANLEGEEHCGATLDPGQTFEGSATLETIGSEQTGIRIEFYNVGWAFSLDEENNGLVCAVGGYFESPGVYYTGSYDIYGYEWSDGEPGEKAEISIAEGN